MYMFSCSKTSVLGLIHLAVFDMSRVAACCKCRYTFIFCIEDTVVSKVRFTLWQAFLSFKVDVYDSTGYLIYLS